MRSRLFPVAAFAAVLVGLLAATAPRASATPPTAQNATELGRIYAAHFHDAQKGWGLADVVSTTPRINVVRTENGGTTWQILWTFMRESDLEGIWMSSERSGVVSGNGKHHRTLNGGRGWTRVRTLFEMSKLSFAGSHGFVVGMPPMKRGTEGPTLLRSTNGGSTFLPVVEQPATVADYCFSTEDRGWIADAAGLTQTTDGGAHWAQKKAVEGLTAVACHGERYAWGVGNGKVYQSFDDGAQWFEHDLGTQDLISDISFVDGSTGWAYGEGKLRQTVDGGLHWRALPAPPGDPRFFDARAGWALDPNGELHKTADAGATWTRVVRATNARTDTAVDIEEDGAEVVPD